MHAEACTWEVQGSQHFFTVLQSPCCTYSHLGNPLHSYLKVPLVALDSDTKLS